MTAESASSRFDWKWVFVGVLLMVGGQVVAYGMLYPVFRSLLQHPDRVLAAATMMAGLGFLFYFVGGVLVGRMSAGHTVAEPAIAGALAMIIVFVLQLLLGMVNVIGLIIGAPFCFGLAYLGGLCGERWQRLAERG